MDSISEKRRIRDNARHLRMALPDRAARSRKIAATLDGLPEFADAATIMLYVDIGSEVQTRRLIDELIANGRRVVVPYCVGSKLRLFVLEGIDELTPGIFGIPEPLNHLRGLAHKSIDPREIDVVLLPGVAFDRQGGRIGQGKGYYDRFLRSLDPRTPLIGLAFECQVFPAVPVEQHDMRVTMVVTEENIYRRAL